jgi:hypothetical protein
MAEHFIATATVKDKGRAGTRSEERSFLYLRGGVQGLDDRTQPQGCYPAHQSNLVLEFIPEVWVLSVILTLHFIGKNTRSSHFDSIHPPNIDLKCISMKNAKRFGSDASIVAILENKYGDILNLGKKTRTVAGAVKKALNMRDETCRFPGCCNNKYINFHHIKFWGEQGQKARARSFSSLRSGVRMTTGLPIRDDEFTTTLGLVN